ncbi:AMP-binding protein [Paraburkholderia sp.]|uniref:AMP-binding protein n=1 Tax=Paraburkholderia sp. TaxID=1926495 RepID=UPI0039E4C77B
MRVQCEIEQLIRERVRVHPDTVWLKFKDDRYAWRQALSLMQRAANGLLKAGVRPGDRVAIMARNRPEFLWAYFGSLFIGAGFVPMNRWQRGAALTHMVNDSGVKVIVYDEDLRETVAGLAGACPKLTTAIVFGEAVDGEIGFDDLMRAPDVEPDVEVVTPSAPVDLLYTSGTTGAPKGVASTDYEQHLAPLRDAIGLRAGETFYSCMPLFHGSGLFLGAVATIRTDGVFAMGDAFSASQFWDEIRRHGAVATQLFSSMFSILLKQPLKSADADNPIRTVLSVGCPTSIWREFEKRFDVHIAEFYGMSDAVGWSVNTDGRVGSAGRPAAGAEFRIVDADDNVLPPDEFGEIVFRHPAGQLTHYNNLPEVTAHAYRGGWFHTGDLGKIDAEGYLYFAGRLKEAIRRRGENITAWEVASVIDQHPKVQESAVFGVPSEYGEEEVMAAIVPQSGEMPTPEEIMDFCQGRVAYYAMPRFIDIVDALPKTSTQKVQIAVLKQRGPTAGTWDRERVGFVVKR